MKSWMTRRRCGTIFGLVVAIAGCSAQNPPVATSKEHEQFEAMDRRHQIDAMVEEAMSAPAFGERTAAALMAAEHSTAVLANAFRAIDQAQDIVLNNIVNAETTAFKASHAVFADGKISGVRLDFSQGSPQSTNRPLDVAIQGAGFFRIKLLDSVGDGAGYTRDGNFFVNSRGDLVIGMGDGYKLTPSISVPTGTTDVIISQDGVVSVRRSGSAAMTVIGQLELSQFVNAETLSVVSSNIFAANDSSGPANACKPGEGGAGQILQGYLESSNVDLFRERLRMRFLQDWRTAILQAVDRAEAKRAGGVGR